MYRIVYENNGISLYEGDKWILSNLGNAPEIIAVRDTLEIMLKQFSCSYTIEH